MNIFNVNNWILPFISSIALTLAGVAVFFTQLKKLSDNTSKELIVVLKEEAVVQKAKAERLQEENQTLRNSHQEQINQLKVEMAKLKTLYEASEKSKQEYLQILQGRNPEQQKFMEFLTKAATMSNKTQEEAKAYMDNTGEVLKQILVFMKSINAKAIANEDRNYRVDNGPTHRRDKSIREIEKMTLASQVRDKK